MSSDTQHPPRAMLSRSGERCSNSSSPSEEDAAGSYDCGNGRVETLVAGGRVKRTSGIQFPFLADFFKTNLEQSTQAQVQADSANSSETRLDTQKSITSTEQQQVRGGLKILDLRSLPCEDGPPTELQARREKFALFERKCSEVAEGLCVGGELVARDKGILHESGITHIVNCIGMLCPACFPKDFNYLTLYLNDATGEDMISLLYDVFAFIEEAVESGGKVLVHCSQGVSRSATFAIGYLMWKHNQPYEKAYQAVKAIRGVTNPNIGFTCQLLNWWKRRSNPVAGTRAYEIMPHSADAKLPQYLVAKALRGEKPVSLSDPKRVLLFQAPSGTFIWKGAEGAPEHLEAARRAAHGLQRFEGWSPAVVVEQGCEPPDLLAALQMAPANQQLGAAQEKPPPFIPRVRLPTSVSVTAAGESSTPNSARTKTPRSEAAQEIDGKHSPNQRHRKVRRSDSTVDGPATARSRSSESIEEGDEALELSALPSLEAPSSFSPRLKTPRSARSTHSPKAPRSPLAVPGLRKSPRTPRSRSFCS